MKKLQIAMLVIIAGAIAGLLTLTKDITTYDSIASARKKEGKYVRTRGLNTIFFHAAEQKRIPIWENPKICGHKYRGTLTFCGQKKLPVIRISVALTYSHRYS